MVVPGVASSATAVEPWKTSGNATGGTAGIPAVGPMVFDGTNYQRLNAASNVGDANSLNGSLSAGLWMFNGANWDRIRPANSVNNTTGTGLLGVGLMVLGATNFVRANSASGIGDSDNGNGQQAVQLNLFNGSNFDRWRSPGADAQTVGYAGVVGLMLNGASFDRFRSSSASNVSGTTQPYSLAVALPGEWTVTHTPASNTQATASKAAGGAGVRHVCRSITASLYGTGGGVAPLQLNLRDGATGAGTIKTSYYLGTTAANAVDRLALSDLNIVGSANTAMTLEFAAAGGANTLETVSMSGYSTV